MRRHHLISNTNHSIYGTLRTHHTQIDNLTRTHLESSPKCSEVLMLCYSQWNRIETKPPPNTHTQKVQVYLWWPKWKPQYNVCRPITNHELEQYVYAWRQFFFFSDLMRHLASVSGSESDFSDYHANFETRQKRRRIRLARGKKLKMKEESGALMIEEMIEQGSVSIHDDVIKWKHFPHYWPFV